MCAVIEEFLVDGTKADLASGLRQGGGGRQCTPGVPKAGSAPDARSDTDVPKRRRSVGSRTRGGLDVQWRDSPC